VSHAHDAGNDPAGIDYRLQTEPPMAVGLSSLATRRRPLRRHRWFSLETFAAVVGWGAIVLLSVWLVLSGIFGLLNG
jgi:hypothetical protein